MAIDENYLDNLLKNANEKEAELESNPGAAQSVLDRINSMPHMNELGRKSVFADDPVVEETIVEEPASIEIPTLSEDIPAVEEPNVAMTPEQIEAMFAQAESKINETLDIPEPVVEEPAPIEITPVSDDPNAAMTPEQIAAMFAQVEAPAEPEPEPAEEPAPIEITPVLDDPNAAMTPEQIAAMFAQVEAPAEPEPEPAEEPAPIEITPVSDDPNAAMTPEQIAAMFAQVEAPAAEPEPEPVEEPAPIEITPVSDDPNAAMTPEQIAAMFAQVEAPAEPEAPAAEPEPEPVVEAVPELEPVVEEPIIEEPTPESESVEDVVPEIELVEEQSPIEITPVSDDPNAAMTPEQIAAMFAQIEVPSESDEPAADVELELPEESDSEFEELLDAASEPSLDDLLAAEPIPDEDPIPSEDPIPDDEPALVSDDLFDETQNSEPMEFELDDLALLDSILKEKPETSDGEAPVDDFQPEEDVNLNEIEELLAKSDNHEFVSDEPEISAPELGEPELAEPFDIFAADMAGQEIAVDEMEIDDLLVNAASMHGDDDEDAEDEEPRRKKKSKEKKTKEKKAKRTKVKKTKNSSDSDEFEDDIPDIGEIQEQEENDKKKGLFSKLADALTEEVEEDDFIPRNAAGEENLAILDEIDSEEESAPAKKKGKKDKKSKKDDPKAKAKAEAAAAKKEAAKKAKAEKAKAAKAAKEEKKKAKAAKEAALGPVKKLPKKKVILIFLVFVPILAGLLVVGLIIPADMELKAARTAYAEKDYDTTYKNMYGQNLSADDKTMYDNSNCILQMRRWKKAYETYDRIGMPREALDALISGVVCRDYLKNHYDTTEVDGEIDSIYNEILSILSSKYGVSEEYAHKIINAETDKMYTRYIDSVLAGDTDYDPYLHTAVPERDVPLNPAEGAEGTGENDTTDPAVSEQMDDEQAYWDAVYEALLNGEEPPARPDQNTNSGTGTDDGEVIMEMPVDGNGNAVSGSDVQSYKGPGQNVNDDIDGERLIYEIPIG